MWYLTVSATVFCYWFVLFMSDRSTPKNHLASWLILIIAPLLWPIVLPISIVELMTKPSPRKRVNEVSNSPVEVYSHNG